MWLHRHLHGVISFAARSYYRVTVAGGSIPAEGPVLLVANHPNSLMDGALVAAATDRPVRFLARAPLFRLRGIAWLIRGTGAIPVYRRDDDPDQVSRNEEMFSAVHGELEKGAVVGIFPEGISHSSPSLAPLKTGAARIALGASRRLASPFPILPVGITFRGGKDRFRSEALALVGPPIEWKDFAGREDLGGEAVRELTRRIHSGLAGVTVNVRSWQDFPIIEGAEAIHAAEFPAAEGRTPLRDPVRWLGRMQETARALDRARETGREEWEPLARSVTRHMRLLRLLGLRPADLRAQPRIGVALRWAGGNLILFGVTLPLAFLGMLVFLPPYLLVVLSEPRFQLPADRKATYRLLGSAVAGGGWVLLVAALLQEFVGWRPAVWALALLPPLGLLTLRVRDRWRGALADVRRVALLRGRRDLRARLLERQEAIAIRIRTLHRAVGEGTSPAVRTPEGAAGEGLPRSEHRP